MLIERGATVKSQDTNGKTPLHLMLESSYRWFQSPHRKLEVVRILLDHGADVNDSAWHKDRLTYLLGSYS